MRSHSNAEGMNTTPSGDDPARQQLSSTAQLMDEFVKIEISENKPAAPINESIAISDPRIYLVDSAGSQILTHSKKSTNMRTDTASSEELSNSFASDGLFQSSLFVMIPPTPIPLGHREINKYEIISDNLSQSFHNIFKVRKKHIATNKTQPIYYLKQNKDNPVDPYVYQLEAVHFAYFRLLTPIDGNHSPNSVTALYNDKQEYVGVLSEAIPDYKSAYDDPLQESDLTIDVLNQTTIEELEKIDLRARVENMQLHDKPNAKIIYAIVTRTTSGSRRINVTVKDLRNFRIVKDLAIGLTTSFILEEDDNHTGNMDKAGHRIDGDMLGWPIGYSYKKCGILDLQFRDPTNRFKITASDFESFPVLNDAAPFYWPTKPAPYLHDSITSVLNSFNINVTKNAFSLKDNEIYKKLTTHPVFIYYKFRTLLKYALTTGEMYRNISTLHLLEEYRHGNKSLIDCLTEHQAERITICKNELTKTPGFIKFIHQYGDDVIKQIINEFADYNFTFTKKIGKMPLYQLQLINLESIIRDYVDICAKIRIVKNPDSIKTHPAIIDLLQENQDSLKKSFK